MSQCTEDLRKAGKTYPRTCAECGLGPCKRYPKIPSYVAEENRVLYYCHPREMPELFLTVYPTKDCIRTPAEQATKIAHVLNSDASIRYRITG